MTFTAAEKLAEIEHHLKVCQEVEHDTGGLGLFQKRISRLAAIAEDYRKLVAEDQAARRKSA